MSKLGKKIVFYFIVISVIISYFPLKVAKDYSGYSLSSKDYIVCLEERVTGCDWSRISEIKADNFIYAIDNRMFAGEGFDFVDTTPLDGIFKLDLSNVYIVYGKQLDEPVKDEFRENVRYTCDDWEILYPVRRQDILGFLLPKRYLCLWDILNKTNNPLIFVFEVIYFIFISVYFLTFVLRKIYNMMKKTRNKDERGHKAVE